MSDLRVLAMALMGWFLALAVGLLLGSSLGTPDRRDRAYEGLRGEFELLRTENQRVQEESAKLKRRAEAGDQAVRDLLPSSVRGRLPGSVIAFIVCGELEEGRFRSELERTLKEAGAEIGPVLRVPDRLRVLTPSDRNRFAIGFSGSIPPAEPLPFEAAAWAVRGMAAGMPAERLQELCSAAGMELTNYQNGPALHRTLLLTGNDPDRAEAVRRGETPDLRLADVARDAGFRLVAAETQESVPAMDAFRRRAVPTVDNIDTASGQLAAVLALAGAEGSFGAKPGAARAIPPVDAP